MKKLFLIFTIFFISISSPSFSQSIPQKFSISLLDSLKSNPYNIDSITIAKYYQEKKQFKQIKNINFNEDDWFGTDKFLHLSVSFVLVGSSYNFSKDSLFMNKNNARNFAITSTISIGILKEIWDSTKEDNFFSLKDLTADIIGTSLGVFIFTR